MAKFQILVGFLFWWPPLASPKNEKHVYFRVSVQGQEKSNSAEIGGIYPWQIIEWHTHTKKMKSQTSYILNNPKGGWCRQKIMPSLRPSYKISFKVECGNMKSYCHRSSHFVKDPVILSQIQTFRCSALDFKLINLFLQRGGILKHTVNY